MASTELLNIKSSCNSSVNLGSKIKNIDHNMTGVNNFSIVYLVTVPNFIKFEVP